MKEKQYLVALDRACLQARERAYLGLYAIEKACLGL